MEITVFAKQRRTKEGKIFYSFLSTLTKKDGTQLVCTVKFREDANQPKPEQCPMNILVSKADANLSTRKFTREVTDPVTGEITTEEGMSHTLWVSSWLPGGQYVDHSLDDFE